MTRVSQAEFSAHPPVRRWATIGVSLLAACWLVATAPEARARACVWKVTSGDHVLYLAGSIHALRGQDYPLPPEYDQAFLASSTLAFESEESKFSTNTLLAKAAYLPRGTTLRDHLDPRVYAYILQVIANVHGSTEPEKKLEHLRPWAIALMLQSSKGIDGLNPGEGVDNYLKKKALQQKKGIVGLVPVAEHIAVFGGMSDADGQALLLINFIRLNQADKGFQELVAAWKRGDTAGVARTVDDEFHDAPSLRRRMLSDRNRRWVPEIVQWLNSGKTYLVVAGAGHMIGDEGVPALLKAQGLKVEQL